MMDIKRGLASIVNKMFDKKISAVSANKFASSCIKSKGTPNKELQKNYTNQLLKNLMKEKYIHFLYIIFGVQI